MSCKYPFRVYKNEDITLSFPVDFDSEPNEFYLHVYTVGDAYVDVPYSALTIEDGVATVVLDAGTLDPLNDGVIRYEMAYSEGDDDYTTDANTNMVLKTPSNYSGKTADEMWMDGYQSGLTDCSGVDCDGVYESGVTAGISQQKAKLADTAITQNATYTRTDGWKRVVVNVPTTGYTQQDLDDAFNRGYQSGYTDGLANCSGDTPSSGDTYDAMIECHDAEGCTPHIALDSSIDGNVEYRIGSGTWQMLQTTAIGQWNRIAQVEVPAWDTIYFRGENDSFGVYISQTVLDTDPNIDDFVSVLSLLSA